MSLKIKLSDDLKEAMKAGNADRVSLLRMVTSSIKNKSIDKKGKGQPEDLTDEDVLEVLTKEAKKRRESVDAFEKGGRSDLAQKEKAELAIIEAYLPKQMGGEEMSAMVKKIVSGLSDKTNFGIVMKEVMKEMKGKADAKLVSDAVKKELGV